VSNPSPTWYDLLHVDRSAGAEEIRAAWKSAIADLDPSDRRFRTYNQAAEVLLDPARRAEYDATLAAEEPEPEPQPTPEPQPAAPAGEASYGPEPTHPTPRRALPFVPAWLLAGLAVLTVAAVVAAGWLWSQGSAESVEESTRAAQTAAEQAVVPILSYDHESLEADQQRARGYLTSDYRDDYDQLFEVISQNAPETQTTVAAEVVSSGIVRSGEDRVQVLVFVDRPTTNKLDSEPVVYKDQVTMTMEKVDDEWLVDDMITSPPQQ
jgi:Mce-associated membrane protein